MARVSLKNRLLLGKPIGNLEGVAGAIQGLNTNTDGSAAAETEDAETPHPNTHNNTAPNIKPNTKANTHHNTETNDNPNITPNKDSNTETSTNPNNEANTTTSPIANTDDNTEANDDLTPTPNTVHNNQANTLPNDSTNNDLTTTPNTKPNNTHNTSNNTNPNIEQNTEANTNLTPPIIDPNTANTKPDTAANNDNVKSSTAPNTANTKINSELTPKLTPVRSRKRLTPPQTSAVTPGLTPPLTSPFFLSSVTSDPAVCVDGQKRQFLEAILSAPGAERGQVPVSIKMVAEHLGVSYGGLRITVCELEKKKFFRRKPLRVGRQQGVLLELNLDLCRRFLDSIKGTAGGDGSGLTPPLTTGLTPSETPPLTQNTAPATAANAELNTDANSAPLLEERKKDLSIYAKLNGIDEADFAAFWPDLAATGFGTHQVRQLVEKRSNLDKPLDYLQQGFDHADATIRLGSLKGAKGSEVKDPCAYVYATLLRDGSFPKPAGWVSPEELAKADAEARLRAIQEADKLRQEADKAEASAAQDQAFKVWREGLSAEELQDAMKGRKGPEDVWLKRIWRERTEQASSAD